MSLDSGRGRRKSHHKKRPVRSKTPLPPRLIHHEGSGFTIPGLPKMP